MKAFASGILSILLVGLFVFNGRSSQSQDWVDLNSKPDQPKPIAPAKTTGTGLLLEPALDLADFTTQQFVDMMITVGKDKIQKPWTSPVVKLPAHTPADAKGISATGLQATGLTEDQVKGYMRQAKQFFEQGKAIPVSDVGLISTQEDVIRKPMLNHISAFENSAVRVYLLVQKTAADGDWGYYSIVQDMTVQPPLDYYGHIRPSEVRLEGTSCYHCHSSGPLAIHPAREDLVLDAKLAAALSEYIAEQPRSRFFFPKDSPSPETGKPLAPSFCTSCHAEDGQRGPLYQVHSHPIRVMVDFGYMPPDDRLSPAQVAELKAWLDLKD